MPAFPHYAKKTAAVGFLVFVGLWITGTIRGITVDFPLPSPVLVSSGPERDSYAANSNWAHNLKQIGLIETPLPLILDKPEVELVRIHEKRAVLTTGTSKFADDEALLRTAIKDHKAEIFAEKDGGIEPKRSLNLEIGVHPDKFDAFVVQLRKVGQLSSINVEQKDRTSEFRKLHAQRQSLKKYLEGMVKLREGKIASLDDSLKLEQKVQDIEKELNSLGVQFGDLLGKESYYHVHVSLVEFQPGDRHDHTYTWPQRIGHAFLWAIAWWFGAALACAVVAATGLSVWVLRQKSVA